MAAAGPQPPSVFSRRYPGRGRLLARIWRSHGPAAWALWPLSLAYGALVALRRWLYRLRVLRTSTPARPLSWWAT